MKRWRWLGFAVCAGMMLAAQNARAQTAYTVSLAQVDTGRYPAITLYVNVRDARGNLVGGLKQGDFSITEDGAAVAITEFAGTGDQRPVDIVFVFDTIGSMADEIESVKRTAISFAQKLKDKQRDYRLGLVSFGDEIRGTFKADGTLTDRAEEFKDWISTLRATGGDDTPENSLGAIKHATTMTYRSDAQKILILITDAPAHHTGDRSGLFSAGFRDPDLNAARIAEILKQKGFTLYAIAYNSSDYTTLARETNGKFTELRRDTDFTNIIDELGTTIAQQYKIAYRSPRPTYDGTRRNIIVKVGEGGSAGGGEYVEQHLVNFKSDWLIAGLLLLPLLFALALPVPFLLMRRAPAPEATIACLHCGKRVRAQARFCAACGQPIGSAPMVVCARCQQPLRADAKFCPRCGARRG
jgi:VWFA-related protein